MKTAALSVLVAFSIPGIALADPPPPEFSISFDEDAAIWNPWEDFSLVRRCTDPALP